MYPTSISSCVLYACISGILNCVSECIHIYLMPYVYTSLQSEYVEVIAKQYVRQGVPGGIIQEATQQDPRTSVTALPHSTDGPMSITSMALIDNKPTRPPSRVSNRPSLPQLGKCLPFITGSH